MLDPNVYPHLVDLVFALASRDALIRLRTASKAFRAEADAQLVADRIIISAPTVDASNPSGNPAGFVGIPGVPNLPSSLITPVIVSSPSGRIPALAAMAQGVVFDPATHDLSRTRIVDFVGLRTLRPEPPRLSCTRSATPPPHACDLLAAPSLDSSRLTVRFMYNLSVEPHLDAMLGPPRSIAGSSDTTVLFTPLPHLFSSSMPAPDLLAWPPLGDVPLRRAVVNISIHPDDTHESDLVVKPANAPEVVWVFHRAVVPVVAEKTAERIVKVGEMLLTLVYAIVVPLGDARAATVVGLEAFAGWKGWEAAPGEEEWQGLVRRFLDLCKTVIGWGFRGWSQDEREDILSRIKFMTLADLRAQLGPERARIETMM